MQIKKYETKDRYGNSKSFEFFEGSADMEVPGMTSMPNHPGEPKGTDTVPAWLTPGEFVINKEATDMYGPLLKNINDEGRKMQNGEPHNHPSEAMYAAAGQPVRRNNEAMQNLIDSREADRVSLQTVPYESSSMDPQEIYAYLISKGFTSNAAKGILGNIKHESNFDPAANQNTGGPGRGLFQYEVGGRYDTDNNNLLKFAADNNVSPLDAKTQLDFMISEMDNTDEYGAVRNKINMAKTPGEAADIFGLDFEKYKGDLQPNRAKFANDFIVREPVDPAGAMAPNEFGDIDLTGAMAADETMYPAITQETLGKPIRSLKEIDKDIATLEARNSAQEVATEDPSFLDRAGDFIRDAVSGYRDLRKDYRKRYIDYYNADQGYFDSIYRQAGGPVPQYYAVGDEVRDYYRSGIPMPGSAPTYNYSNAPTFETMADTIKDKLEKEEAERLREAQEERFGAVDKLSMDRLQTMKYAEKIDALKRERAEALRIAYNNSSAREDAFNKNYYTGVPGDVPSADEFMNIPKDTMPPKIDVAPIDPTFYDAFGNPYDDAEQARASDVISEADSKAGMQKQMQINSLGQRVPITGNNFYNIPESEVRGINTVNSNLIEDTYDINSKVYGPEKVPQNVSNGDVIFRKDTNMLYTVDDKGVLTDSYGRVADTETMQAFVDFQKGNDSEIKLSKYQPPSAASLEELNKRKAELTNKANDEIKLNGQVSKETTEVLGEINSKISIVKGQATQTGTAETRRWRDRETKRRKDAEKETKKLMLKYKDAKRNANRLGIADFPSFEDWAKRQNIDPAKIDTQNYLKKGVNIGPAANDIIDTEGLGLTDDQLANSGALTSRLDSLDDGSAENFDVNTVEQKGNAELGLGESFNLDGVVKKALENKNPKFVKTKSFLSKYFGNLFDTEELARMAVLYLGSRAMGASHNGSLAWSGKYYLKRMENKDASHAKNVEKAIAAKLYTPASIEKYKKSRNLSDLKSIKTGSSYALKGDRKEFYNPKLNKRDMAIKVEMTGADGVKQQYYTLNPYDKNKPGYMQPMNMDWTTDDSRVKGSKGYSSLLKTNTDLIEGQLDEWIKNDVKDDTHPATRLTAGSKTMAGQTAEWAMSYGFDAANLGSVSKIAYENMISYMRANPEKEPGDIKVFLDAALVRQTANRGGNLFDPLDGKTPNDDRIKALNEQFMKSGKSPISTWKTFEGRSQLDLKYKNAIALFNQDMLDNPEYINKTVTNNTKPGESIFMAWLRRELSGLGPTPTKKSTK